MPKAQRTQGIEDFDFDLKHELQQSLKSWYNFSLILFGKGQEKWLWQIHETTLTNACNNLEKSMKKLWQIQQFEQNSTRQLMDC